MPEDQRRLVKDEDAAWTEFRSQSTEIFVLSFGYVMTGRREFADKARDLMLAYAAYDMWGPPKADHDIDLVASMPLSAMAVGYDWCYDALTDAQRQTLRQAMLKHAAIFAKASTGQEMAGYAYPWWFNHEFQNHGWVNYSGLGLAALAMLDEEPSAKDLLQPALKFYRGLFKKLSPDGSWHEGCGYWAYGLTWGLMFTEALRSRTGESVVDGDWPRNTVNWRLYMDIPDFQHNTLQFDDGPDDHSGWMAPYYLLARLVAQYGDGYAQTFLQNEAKTIDAQRHGDGHSFAGFAFLWYDPAVKPKALDDLPRRKSFPDGGYAVMRGGWAPTPPCWASAAPRRAAGRWSTAGRCSTATPLGTRTPTPTRCSSSPTAISWPSTPAATTTPRRPATTRYCSTAWARPATTATGGSSRRSPARSSISRPGRTGATSWARRPGRTPRPWGSSGSSGTSSR